MQDIVGNGLPSAIPFEMAMGSLGETSNSALFHRLKESAFSYDCRTDLESGSAVRGFIRFGADASITTVRDEFAKKSCRENDYENTA